MLIDHIHHVQLAMPSGQEGQAHTPFHAGDLEALITKLRAADVEVTPDDLCPGSLGTN